MCYKTHQPLLPLNLKLKYVMKYRDVCLFIIINVSLCVYIIPCTYAVNLFKFF